MSLLVCPHCDSDTPLEHNFCVACNKQVRCLNSSCSKMLLAGKPFCFGCGQPVADVPSVITSEQQPLNRYVRDVKQKGDRYEEHTDLSLTDHAVSKLAPYIGGQVFTLPSTAINKEYQAPRVQNHVATQLTQHETPQLLAGEPPADQEQMAQSEPSAAAQPQHDQSIGGAARYFERDGDALVATTNDFKGKDWAEQQRHFIVLFGSAYEHFFHTPIPNPARDLIKSAAEKVHVYDTNNFTRYLGTALTTYFAPMSTGMKLNDSGRKEAARIVSLMSNDSAEPGFAYWNRVTSGTIKRARLDKNHKARLHEWAQDEVDLGDFSIRSITKPLDYAMLAVWIITIHLKKSPAVLWNEAYYYLKEKYQTVSASPEAFSAAMKHKDSEQYFRSSDDNFYLTDEGQRTVEGWLNGGSTKMLGSQLELIPEPPPAEVNIEEGDASLNSESRGE